MKYKVIGLIGVNGSGKDFKAKELESEFEDSKIFDFSDGVRDYTFHFLGGRPIGDLAYDEFKKGDNNIFLGKNRNRVVKGRQFLDNVGKKMRDYDENFWVNYTVNDALDYFYDGQKTNFIFGSCRYFNEITGVIKFYNKVLEESNGLFDLEFIFCDYKSEKYDDSPKEYQKLALYFRDELNCSHYENVTEKVLEYINKNYDKKLD